MASMGPGPNKEQPEIEKLDKRKQEIMRINRDPNLSPAEKQKAIQELMLQSVIIPQPAPVPSDDETKITYNDEEKRILGCPHYQRGCKIRAPCCQRLFGCRLCHDEQTTHPIERRLIAEMLCMHCNTLQPVSQHCSNPQCQERISRYYCGVCKLFDDFPGRDVYHCEQCGLCRRGKGLGIDYFHCETCDVCMDVSLQGKHECIERTLHSNCPVCRNYLFTSVEPVTFLPCGHPIHSKCRVQLLQTSSSCPVCHKSTGSQGEMAMLWQAIDAVVAQQPMPVPYSYWKASVLCNDCLQTTVTRFHFLYHKCQNCGAYNTQLAATHRHDSPQDGDT